MTLPDWHSLGIYAIPLAQGTLITLALTAGATVVGFIIAVALVMLRRSRMTVFRWCAACYGIVFRGMPLLVTIFLIYFGPGQFVWVRNSVAWPLLREPYFCALLALSLVTAAYVAEFVYGALANVPRGPLEAARALGLGPWAAFWLVTIPMAARTIVPLYSSEILLLLKGSSLVSTITIIDLTGAANVIYYRTYDPYFPFLTVAAIYLFLGVITSRIGLWLERKVNFP